MTDDEWTAGEMIRLEAGTARRFKMRFWQHETAGNARL